MATAIVNSLRPILATTFHLYLKTHKFHWNVMGSDFKQFHDFFGDMYEELFDSIDGIAEAIRTQGELAPGSFQEYMELTLIDDDSLAANVTDPVEMIKDLLEDNSALISALKDAYKVSEEAMTFDISDMLAARIAAHSKHSWMMNAINSNTRG